MACILLFPCVDSVHIHFSLSSYIGAVGSSSLLQVVFGSHQCVTYSQGLNTEGFSLAFREPEL